MQPKHYVMAALYLEKRIPLRYIGPLFNVAPGYVWNVVTGHSQPKARHWKDLTWREKAPYLEEAESLIEANGLKEKSMNYPSNIAVVQAMWWVLGLRGATISKIMGMDRRSVCASAKGRNKKSVTVWEDRPPETQRLAIELAREKFREYINERE